MDGSGLKPDLVGMGSIGYPNVRGSHLFYDSYRDGVGNIGLCRGDINKGASYIIDAGLCRGDINQGASYIKSNCVYWMDCMSKPNWWVL